MNKKLINLQYSILILSAVFSLINIKFAADISLTAFFVSALFTVVIFYFGVLKLYKKNEVTKVVLVRKLYQYLPFVLIASFVLRRAGESGTSFAFDVICEILWIICCILIFVFLYMFDDKRLYKNNPVLADTKNKLPLPVKNPIKKIFKEIFEWVDAFIQAAFTVTLINLFIFQLYEIPSESMVSEFLVKDRVVGVKFLSGPKFPLSSAGIPQLRNYERGDIVIFRNPHYQKDRKSEVKNFVYQLVYMLTFTGVNLNVDESGQLKADPLVKRVTGEPGEQLMMQDGVLYKRTKDDPIFKAVTDDAKWAQWNVDSLPQKIKSDVRDIPLTTSQYNQLKEVEKLRNELSYKEALAEAENIVKQFNALTVKKSNADVSNLFSKTELYVYNLFAMNDTICRKIMTVDGGSKWFENFMTSWKESIPSDGQYFNGNLYDDANFKLNVMLKLKFGNLILRNAQLFSQDVSTSNIMKDAVRVQQLKEAESLYMYVMLLDRRNMPVFPANDANGNPVFIPKNNYFLMGDNRFNSLDMRHSYEQTLVPLTKADDYSVTYYTNMAQQFIPSKDILGTAALRFWPLNRFGIPSKK